MSGSPTEPGPFSDLPIHVADTGEGEITVLLHSSGMSGDQWKRTAEHLVRRGYRALVPDLLGSGRNAPWLDGKPFSFHDDLAIVTRLLQLAPRPVHLVGHSYGGLVALRAAALDPARVRSIALYDPVALGVLDPELAADAEGLSQLSHLRFGWGETEAEHEAFLERFVNYWGGEGAWPRLREPARAEFRRIGWIVHEGARSLTLETTGADAYRALRIPALFVTGEHSPPAAQRVVAHLGEAVPGARVERIAGAGHMGPLTHGKQLNELLSAHLAAAV
ncbi:MAG: alpha/beta hydrolase [Byssovorax sp.]